MASTKNNCCRRLEERIDEIESEMIQVVQDIATGARQNLRRLIIEQKNDTRQHYDEMTSGSDLDRLINNLEQIKKKLTEMSSTQNNETDIHVYPEDRTDAPHINVKDYEERIDDMGEVVTVTINESEQTNIVSNNNLKLKLTEHSPKMTIDIRSGPYP
jgi:primosomal protein N''